MILVYNNLDVSKYKKLNAFLKKKMTVTYPKNQKYLLVMISRNSAMNKWALTGFLSRKTYNKYNHLFCGTRVPKYYVLSQLETKLFNSKGLLSLKLI